MVKKNTRKRKRGGSFFCRGPGCTEVRSPPQQWNENDLVILRDLLGEEDVPEPGIQTRVRPSKQRKRRTHPAPKKPLDYGLFNEFAEYDETKDKDNDDEYAGIKHEPESRTILIKQYLVATIIKITEKFELAEKLKKISSYFYDRVTKTLFNKIPLLKKLVQIKVDDFEAGKEYGDVESQKKLLSEMYLALKKMDPLWAERPDKLCAKLGEIPDVIKHYSQYWVLQFLLDKTEEDPANALEFRLNKAGYDLTVAVDATKMKASDSRVEQKILSELDFEKLREEIIDEFKRITMIDNNLKRDYEVQVFYWVNDKSWDNCLYKDVWMRSIGEEVLPDLYIKNHLGVGRGGPRRKKPKRKQKRKTKKITCATYFKSKRYKTLVSKMWKKYEKKMTKRTKTVPHISWGKFQKSFKKGHMLMCKNKLGNFTPNNKKIL